MNTRFNPTANGQLHVGHLYLALLNYHAARRSGGRFVLRLDDDQDHWLVRLGRRAIDGFCEAAREDLAWAGIEPDLVSWESRERFANEVFVRRWVALQRPFDPVSMPVPEWAGCDQPYPFVPYLTAVKVAQDHREGCDLLIRGEELATEFALYHYFCRLFDIPPPRFQYAPRLTRAGGPLSDVSKRSGNFKIADFRAKGCSPEAVIDLLARCCLADPHGPWAFTNLKKHPALEVEAACGLS